MTYTLIKELPSPQIYCDIRVKVGLSPRSLESATRALPKSIFGVSVIDRKDNSVVGMGRIIGDEECFLTVVDICVLKEHQKKGLGKLIMAELMEFIKTEGSPDADVTLIAVGDAKYLYEQYGFYSTIVDGSMSMRYNRKFNK